MNISLDTNIELDHYISTYGGEYTDRDIEWDEYGIQIGDLSISDIPASAMKILAITMVNHLMLNGHDFEFASQHDQDRPIIFQEKK